MAIILVSLLHQNEQDQTAFIQLLKSGDRKAIARAITIVENELPVWDTILQALSPSKIPVVGITGPPGAGEDTLSILFFAN